MIDKDKRKAEIKTIILGCIEGNQDWPDDMADTIITQEQSMIEKLEADKAEILQALKEWRKDWNYEKVGLSRRIADGCLIDFYDNLIQKMEK
ncbi:MAG: hypothetical protein M0P71_17635 [Melioribacteraceae bacterium]|jgi:hypothetical protein|nr:hypothetical protein [Melioribacteraceae bacterium]